MKGISIVIFICLVSLACSPSRTPSLPPQPMDEGVRNFGLHDHLGNFHRLYYYSDAKAVVLYVQGNSCPIVRKSLQKLDELKQRYEKEGIVFFMINSNLQDNRETIAEEARNYQIDMPILVDEDQVVADLLDLQITAESIVLNPSDWTFLYRGPLDDQLGYGSDRGNASESYLEVVLNRVAAEETLASTYIQAKGCAIARLEKMEDYDNLTYTDDIAPILKANCIRCHQPDGIAPWAMTGYPMVVGWSAMMQTMLTTGLMPPWQADPHIGTFSNDLSLSQDEKRKILSWIQNGRKRGDGIDILEGNESTAADWSFGQPDYQIALREESIPATGVVDYRYQEVSLDLEEDRYVRAVEIKPGNPNILHHVLARVQYPEGQTHPVKIRGSEWLDGLLLGWAPGGETEVFPENSGRKIPAGSRLTFQLHYTTSGKAETDETLIGLYFHDDMPEKEYIIYGPADFNFEIPAYAKNHPVTAVEKFDRPVVLYAMLPHMHYRGKSMSYVAHYPDGTQETILSVPDYNFNWQRFYYLEEPKYLPAGSSLRVNAVFDNSRQNEFNPDPSKTLYFGDQTFDEMMIGYMSFVYVDEGDNLSSM